MRRAHFEALRPVCPGCGEAELVLESVGREEESGVIEGGLRCGHCGAGYPIVDGIPIITKDVRRLVTEQADTLLQRDDLGAGARAMIGDAIGPGTRFDAIRQQISSYGWDHYAEGGGSVLRGLGRGLELLGDPPAGPAIDLGCGPGRTAFALAEASDGLVLGIDTHLGLLRLAARVLRTGRATFDLRRLGMDYEPIDVEARFAGADRVDFWACDAQALPFVDGAFSFCSALHLHDCVPSPRALTNEIARVTRPGAGIVLATPYDWSPAATPSTADWVGLSDVLGESFRVVGEEPELEWTVRLHDRGTSAYAAHLVAAVRAS